MKQIEAVFFDIDGTLLDFQTHTIAQSSMEAIRDLQAKGIKVALNSSRPYLAMKKADNINAIQWDGYVGANGQEIRNDKLELIKDESISQTKLNQIAKIAKENHISLYLVGEQSFFTEENEIVYELIQKYDLEAPTFKPYENEKIGLITVLSYEKEKCISLFKDIEGINVIDAGPYNLDIFPKGITKGTGCMDLMKYWNLDSYMCFGDTAADEEMMKYADISIAMNNALESTKKAADYTCPTTSIDSIQQALIHFDLL